MGWPAFSRDLEHPAILKAREAAYYELVGRLQAATFRVLAADRTSRQRSARAYVNYAPLNYAAGGRA